MLARDVRKLLESPRVSGLPLSPYGPPAPLILFQGDRTTRLLSCRAQLSLLQAHLLILNSPFERGSINELRDIFPYLRMCIIITLVKRAELYNDMHQSSLPSALERAEYRSSCRESLAEAVTVTAEFSPDEYYYLDPYLGVGTFVSYWISEFIYLGLGHKVCWNRAISLLSEEPSDGLQPGSDPHTASGPSTQASQSFTAETLETQLRVLRLARRSVGMCVCLVPSGPKTLCSQLREYGRASSLNSLGRFTEV